MIFDVKIALDYFKKSQQTYSSLESKTNYYLSSLFMLGKPCHFLNGTTVNLKK
jgi:hypothetical protein